MADDFVQFLFGGAAAEGEGAGEIFPIVQRQAVKVARLWCCVCASGKSRRWNFQRDREGAWCMFWERCDD